jgi:guanylate kinase
MRVGEHQGGEYHFVSRDFFHSLISAGLLNDWDYVFGEYYGAYLSDVQSAVESNTLVFIHALAKIAIRTASRFPKGVLTVMLLPSADLSLVEDRLLARKVGDVELRARLKHSEDEIAHVPLMKLLIRNADTRKAGDVLDEVVYHAKHRM